MLERSWPVFAAALLVYGSGAARTVQGGDAGEFMTLAALGGVAHPPGYPLFTALLRLLGMIPLGTPAWRASLASAALAAGALALLHAAVRARTGSGAAGWVAAGTLGLSLSFWQYATVAEVFAGGAFTAALVLLVSARIAGGWRGWRAQLALGLAVATGIANHHTVILLAPLAIWAWAEGLSRPLTPRRAAAESLVCAAGLSAGFAAYLLLLLPGGGWRWGETQTLSGLVHHFLRRDYGTFQLARSDVQVRWWDHPLLYLRRLPGQLWLGLVAALVGLADGLRRRSSWAIALALTWALSGPVFLSRFNVDTQGLGRVVAVRFHLLPTVMLAAFAGLGAAAAAARLDRRVVYGLLGLSLAGQAVANSDEASHARWTVMEDYVLNALGAVEPGALIIGASDSFFFGTLYAQRVLEVRPDVAYVHPSMLSYSWYVRDLKARHPELHVQGPVSIPALVAAHIGERPVYLSREYLAREGLEAALPPTWPESAVLMRVAPPGSSLPHPAQVEAQLDAAVAGFTFRSRLRTRHQWEETWEAWAVKQYAGAYRGVAQAWAAAGDERGRTRCMEKARAFAPFLREAPRAQ